LEEITRIGHQSIIVIPNFGHWKSRLTVFLGGKMPITKSLPEKWYDTPNIHLCTVADFENLCSELDIVVEDKKILNAEGRVSNIFSGWSNLLSSAVIYRLSR
jgi:methionine biosynthesis protein MetW